MKTPETTALGVSWVTPGHVGYCLTTGSLWQSPPTHGAFRVICTVSQSLTPPLRSSGLAPRGAPLLAGPATGPCLCVCSGRGSESGEARGRGWGGTPGARTTAQDHSPEAGQAGAEVASPGLLATPGAQGGSQAAVTTYHVICPVTRGPSQGQAVAHRSRRGWEAALWSQGAGPVRSSGSSPVPPKGVGLLWSCKGHHGVVLLAGARQRPRWGVASLGQASSGRGCWHVWRSLPGRA